SFELIIRVNNGPDLHAKYRDRIHQPFANFFNAYAKGINKRYGRSGSLFREHYKRQRLDFCEYQLLKNDIEAKVITHPQFLQQ
uniref:hypothetical protein n=1 Tax=Klebsiella pneumoniae TaxID=573 RepID=UPI0037BE77DB